MRFDTSKGWGLHFATALAAAAMLWAVSASAQKTELLVYTALETDQIKAYEEGFYKAVPDRPERRQSILC